MVMARPITNALLALEHAVADLLAHSDDPASCYPQLLGTAGAALGWRAGAAWLPPVVGAGLRCTAVWAADPLRAAAFADESWRTTLAPGVGLPGRVWRTGEPAWIADVATDDNFPRRDAALRSGL